MPAIRSPETHGSGPADVALTICIPTYQRPKGVARTIRSVIASGAGVEGRVEVLVSDNSPDVSAGAVRSALTAWSGRTVYLANRPNIGAVANFNQCIDRAAGRYVLILHDDDMLLPRAVPELIAAIDRPEVQPVLLFGAKVVDGRGRLVRQAPFDEERNLTPSEALRHLLSDIEFVRFPAMVVRRDAYLEAGPFDERYGNATDLEMWVRLLARHGLGCLPVVTSLNTVHRGAATFAMAFDKRAIETFEEIFDVAEATGVLPHAEIRECRREFLHQFILGAAYLRLQGAGPSEARRVLQLFRLPTMRRLGWSMRWLPARIAFETLLHAPAPVRHGIITWLDRHDLVRRVRVRRRVRF